MRIECIHGYFIFIEEGPGQVSDFMSLFDLEIEKSESGEHFTFSDLKSAPKYSLPGKLYLDAPAIKAFEGEPWEVMRANGLVYNFVLGLVVPLETITTPLALSDAGNYFAGSGMILAGSVTEDGSRVTDYSAFFSQSSRGFRYSEVTYG